MTPSVPRRHTGVGAVTSAGTSTHKGGRGNGRGSAPGRILRLICLAFLLLGLGASGATRTAQAQADCGEKTPPVLTALDFGRAVDVRAAPGEVPVSAHATDNASGVRSVHVTFRSPEGSDAAGTSMHVADANSTSTPITDADVSGTLRIPQFVEGGTWTVSSVRVFDGDGNSHTYAPTAPDWSPAWPTTLTVSSNHDTTPPTISSFDFQPRVADATAEAAEVSVTASASDDLSGVSSAYVSFMSPSATHGDSAHLSVTQTGALAGTLTIPPGVEPGNWTVSTLSVRDRRGNSTNYAPDATWGAGWPTDLTVFSVPAPPPAPPLPTPDPTPTPTPEPTPTPTPPPSCPDAAATGVAAPLDVPGTPLPSLRTPRVPGAPALPGPASDAGAPGAPAPPTQVRGIQTTAPDAPPSTPVSIGDSALSGRSRLAASLIDPGDVSFDLGLVVANALLAAAAVLLIAFPAELFNKTVEENREAIRRWPWVAAIRSFVSKAGANVHGLTTGRNAMTILLVASGLLYSLLDPDFPGSLPLVIANVGGIAAAFWVVTMVYEYGAGWFSNRWHGQSGTLALSPGALGIALACVTLSRLVDFQPGYLYGIVAGIDFAGRLSDEEEGKAIGAAACALLAVGFLAWLLWVPIGAGTGAGSNVLRLTLDAGLATIFVASIEALVFGLFPLRFLDGEKVKAWNLKAWFALYGVGMFLFFHILLRPAEGGYESAPTASWTMVIGLAAVFASGSIALWAYFRYFAPEPSDASGDDDLIDLAGDVMVIDPASSAGDVIEEMFGTAKGNVADPTDDLEVIVDAPAATRTRRRAIAVPTRTKARSRPS